MSDTKKLKKELSFFNLYAIAIGATLSSGFFLLPGLAYVDAGPAILLSYIIAAIPLLPGLLSMAELSTAMPKAGGAYFFLDRSMGPLIGTIGGLGTWFALILKTTFALVGMGAYIKLLMPNASVDVIAIACAIFFGVVNMFGAKKTAKFQIFLVIGIFIILFWFNGVGLTKIEHQYFDGFFDKEFSSVFATAGFVYISYIGVTKIASVAEEVQNPERTIPLSMFIAYISAVVIYGVSIYVLVGVVSPEDLNGNYTPVATAAENIAGYGGKLLVTIAAILAFSSVANAGILSSSRYPLAMSRDNLMPQSLTTLSRYGTPKYSLYITVAIILFIIVCFNPAKIAKLASAFQLVAFAFICAAVIVMRESGLSSYDPGYRSPFYPWMQILGILSSAWLIAGMGWLPILFSSGLVVMGATWYYYYAKKRVKRSGAILHAFARLGENRNENLDRELRGIIKDKGLRAGDPYDVIITDSLTLMVKDELDVADLVKKASEMLAQRVPLTSQQLQDGFLLKGAQLGNTPVIDGIALPHLHVEGIDKSQLLIVQAVNGIKTDVVHHSHDGDYTSKEDVYAIFFLVSPEGQPRQHLRILARIASHVEQENFRNDWLEAKDEKELKEILLHEERFISLQISSADKTAAWIDKVRSDLPLPKSALLTLVRREGEVIVPNGETKLQEGDQLTIIGHPKGIAELYKTYKP